MGRRLRGPLGIALFTGLLFAGPLINVTLGRVSVGGDWRSAPHRPAGLAPDPATHPEAVVQVYAGRTFGWRGAFAVHTWLAAKPAGADHYTRYEVIGWLARAGGSAVAVGSARAPDAEWYGAPPVLLADLRGAQADDAIARLPAAVERYPYANEYRAWPGPNSNTFVAHLGRELPELRLAMPSTAIGKDYPMPGAWLMPMPSGTGYQVSLGGVAGVGIARAEGLELNVLGLVTGVGLSPPSVKLPGLGSVPGGGAGASVRGQ